MLVIQEQVYLERLKHHCQQVGKRTTNRLFVVVFEFPFGSKGSYAKIIRKQETGFNAVIVNITEITNKLNMG